MTSSQCHVGSLPLLPGSPTLLPLASSAGSCFPSEGLCYYSVSRGDGQVTAQFGCWPSQIQLPVAWLGQLACRQEVGRTTCLCTTDKCNLRVPVWEEQQPEGTEVQGIVAILLLGILEIIGITMIFIAAVSLSRSWKQQHPSTSSPDLKAGLASAHCTSRCCLLVPWSHSPCSPCSPCSPFSLSHQPSPEYRYQPSPELCCTQ